MKIRPVGTEVFYADRRMDGQTDMTKLVVAYSNFENASSRINQETRWTQVLEHAISSYGCSPLW